jgi:hypothetical protein
MNLSLIYLFSDDPDWMHLSYLEYEYHVAWMENETQLLGENTIKLGNPYMLDAKRLPIWPYKTNTSSNRAMVR